jgi:hypothetical protein
MRPRSMLLENRAGRTNNREVKGENSLFRAVSAQKHGCRPPSGWRAGQLLHALNREFSGKSSGGSACMRSCGAAHEALCHRRIYIFTLYICGLSEYERGNSFRESFQPAKPLPLFSTVNLAAWWNSHQLPVTNLSSPLGWGYSLRLATGLANPVLRRGAPLVEAGSL